MATRGRRRRASTSDNDDALGNVTKATFLGHFDKYVEALRAKATADAKVANSLKAAEQDGVDRKELKKAYKDSLLTAEELAVQDSKHAKYRQWLGKPVGYQAAFEMPTAAAGDDTTTANGATHPDPADAEHANNEAYQAGWTAGRAGADVASCPYQPGTEEHQQYSLGWGEGQRDKVSELGAGLPDERRSPMF